MVRGGSSVGQLRLWVGAHALVRQLGTRASGDARAVGLFDMSSFAKFRVEGPDAEAVLQDLCTCDAAIEPGQVRYTQWLNANGGIEADLTISRLDWETYLVVTGAAVAGRDFTWLKRHIGERRAVATDVTSGVSSLGLMGPRSRDLLAVLSGDDVSDNALPYRSAAEIEIGYAPVRAVRISYMGELGYELYVATEFAQHLFDLIAEAGADFGLAMAGHHAMDSLRQEKGFRHWGHDIGIEDNPFEAGLGFAIDWNVEFASGATRWSRCAAGRRLVGSYSSNSTMPKRECTTTNRSIGTVSGLDIRRRRPMDIRSVRLLGWVTRQ